MYDLFTHTHVWFSIEIILDSPIFKIIFKLAPQKKLRV
jgi:hypothetical protein